MLLMGNARPPTVGPQGAPWSAVGLLSLCLVLGLTHAARQRRLPVMVAGGVDSAPAQRLGSTGSRLTLRVAFVVCQELFRVMERIDSRLAVVEMWRR